MRTSLGFIASSTLFTLAAAGGDCPVKTFDPSDKGATCEYVRHGSSLVVALTWEYACSADYTCASAPPHTWRENPSCSASKGVAKGWRGCTGCFVREDAAIFWFHTRMRMYVSRTEQITSLDRIAQIITASDN